MSYTPVIGLYYKSKHAADCRQPGPGEARVTILTKRGDLVCRKIGHLSPGGTCTVTWLQVEQRAEKRGASYVYQIPTEPGVEPEEECYRCGTGQSTLNAAGRQLYSCDAQGCENQCCSTCSEDGRGEGEQVVCLSCFEGRAGVAGEAASP